MLEPPLLARTLSPFLLNIQKFSRYLRTDGLNGSNIPCIKWYLAARYASRTIFSSDRNGRAAYISVERVIIYVLLYGEYNRFVDTQINLTMVGKYYYSALHRIWNYNNTGTFVHQRDRTCNSITDNEIMRYTYRLFPVIIVSRSFIFF